MKNKIRILVTGACGVTSRSVVRSLMVSTIFKEKCEFIGTDICNLWYGVHEKLYEKVYRVPMYDDPTYRDTINSILLKEKIDLAIIIPEPEVLYWSEYPFDVKFMKIPPKFAKIVLSKKNLYEELIDTDLIPKYQIIKKELIVENPNNVKLEYPCWIRDYSEGTTSGKGSFKPQNIEELNAWLIINPQIDNFMLSEYLPGRNFACFLLYNNGSLLKYGVAERIDYIMSKVSVSGITGNTSKGKLLNDANVFSIAKSSVDIIVSKTKETMNGLIVVDLKENSSGQPLVTEINIRHVAFTSSFATAGFNFSEFQLLCMLDRINEISPELTNEFPEENIILRDVDGLPLYIEHFKELEVGQYY
jgi:hypothetical protein